MAITYFCTDRHGNTYRRCSVQHTGCQYEWAVITRHKDDTTGRPVGKSSVSYSRTLSLADGMKRRSELCGATAEIVRVRPYPGNHKAEPTV